MFLKIVVNERNVLNVYLSNLFFVNWILLITRPAHFKIALSVISNVKLLFSIFFSHPTILHQVFKPSAAELAPV